MYIGFDTSNYTTSAATYDGKTVCQAKQVLTVKPGERGLRQSDAVFQHTVNMPKLCKELAFEIPKAVGVSTRPRNVEGSYMPCFLVGENAATVLSSVNGIPLYKTSHQVGHILAALYSAERLDLINQTFLAFHLSGGTTEALLVEPADDEIIKATVVANSTDLKAGQAVDRTGVMLGITFPCGKELDRLSLQSEKEYKIKPTMLDGNCSLSGVENKAKNMIDKGENAEDVAKFVLTYIAETVSAMLGGVVQKYGDLPVVFSGGVASNSLLRKTINERYNAYFAASEFSLDNAAGTAIYAYLKDNR
ncbi:MAG: peptidase M22 [Clostridia bacterium]|nr:peptidase M22 [Clostridia bacterium]